MVGEGVKTAPGANMSVIGGICMAAVAAPTTKTYVAYDSNKDIVSQLDDELTESGGNLNPQQISYWLATYAANDIVYEDKEDVPLPAAPVAESDP